MCFPRVDNHCSQAFGSIGPSLLQALIGESTRDEVCDGLKVPSLAELGPLTLLGHSSKGQLSSTVGARSRGRQGLFPGSPTWEGGPSLSFFSDPRASFPQPSGSLLPVIAHISAQRSSDPSCCSMVNKHLMASALLQFLPQILH